MRRLACLALLGSLVAGGCAFDPGGVSRDGGGDDDGDDDGIDAPPGCGCALGCEDDGSTCLAFDPSNLEDLSLLDDATDAPALIAGTWTLDTTAATLRDATGSAVAGLSFTVVEKILVWAIHGLDIDAGATLRVIGELPLLILASGPVHVDGTIDVSAGCVGDPTAPDRDRLWCAGPGGGNGGHPDANNDRTDAGGCAPGGNGDAGVTRSENGGGGGGFGTGGGDGGGVDGIGADSEGGAVCGAVALEPLEGGSGGGATGYFNNASDDNRSAGGGGGGGLQITSRISIEITGVIDASGEGGAGTAQAGSTEPGGDGGGGGGAGGGVLLEAPGVYFQTEAIVVANGGGGGAGVTADRRGERGRRSHVRAAGGLNDDETGGGFGAIGEGTDEGATSGDDAGDGGSGGGGGAGRIRIHAVVISVSISAVVSPPASNASLSPL